MAIRNPKKTTAQCCGVTSCRYNNSDKATSLGKQPLQLSSSLYNHSSIFL